MSYLTEAKQRELEQANFTETASYLVNHYSYATPETDNKVKM